MRRRLLSQLIVLVVVIAAAGSIVIAAPKKRETRGAETTIRGRLVDVHSFMTGKSAGEDRVRATQDSFRAGAAAAIETPEGLVVLGSGDKGPSRIIIPLALQQVEAKGKLYERGGFRYLDMESIQTKHGAEVEKSEDAHDVAGEEPTDGSDHEPTDEQSPDDESEEP